MRPLAGYPTAWGSNKASVFPHAGPVVYAAMTVTPIAGGDVVNVRPEAGMKFADFVTAQQGGYSDSGTFFVKVAITAGHASGGPGSPGGAPTPTVRLQWFVTGTGVEVAPGVDLHLEIVRLLAVGPK